MALRDYRYTGFEDENSITEIILYSLPKVVRARKERIRYLETHAMSGSPMSGNEKVQGGDDTPKLQRYLEGKERDRILSWLSTIEARVSDKVKHLPPIEKEFIREYYFSGKVMPMGVVAKKLGIEGRAASSMRVRVIGKLRRSCTSVYHLFCLWREHDDMEMEERRSELEYLLNDKGAA